MRILIGAMLVVMMVGVFGCASVDTLAEIEERGSIKFAMSGGYPPFNYFDDQGNLVGFDVEIGQEVARRLGVEYEPVVTNWDGILIGLTAGQYDGILGSMAITEDRLEQVDFTDPYYYSGAQLVVQSDSAINGAADVTSDMRIAVVTGTTFADQVEEWGAEPVYYESDALTLNDLASGQVDGVITDALVALNTMQDQGYDLKLAGDMLYTEELAVAVRKGDENLAAEINSALQEMRADGTYQEISQRYFGRDIGNIE